MIPPLAVVLSERHKDASPPGHARRIDSLERHYAEAGFRVEHHTIGVTEPASKLSRVAACVAHSNRWIASLPAEVICVSGLGSPQMLWVANHLARSHAVTFDACDSWLLQQAARRRVHESEASSVVGGFLTRLSRGVQQFSYISTRDALADARLHGGRSVVIPQQLPAELSLLDPVNRPLRRVVVPADFRSYHNRAMSGAALRSAAIVASRNPSLRVEAYGLVEHTSDIPPGVALMPWAGSLAEIYAGDTGVVITNVEGSGIPNKFIEARAARRPMVLHDSLRYLATDPTEDLTFFHNESEIEPAIESMVNGIKA